MLMRKIRVAVRVFQGDVLDHLIPPHWQGRLGVPADRWHECPALRVTSDRYPHAVDLYRCIERRLPRTGLYTQEQVLQGLAAAYADAGCADLWSIGQQWLEHYGITA